VPKIVAVCSSEEKGTRKKSVSEGLLREDYGLVVDKMLSLGVKVGPGDFAENITTEGIDLVSLSIGTRISIGEDVLLEVTQIGKECHTPCAIYRQAGVCVMPTEGIFTTVICGGVAKVGDQLKVYQG